VSRGLYFSAMPVCPKCFEESPRPPTGMKDWVCPACGWVPPTLRPTTSKGDAARPHRERAQGPEPEHQDETEDEDDRSLAFGEVWSPPADTDLHRKIGSTQNPREWKAKKKP
jgi:hypothetical protein